MGRIGIMNIPKVLTNQEILERKLNTNQKNKFLTHFQKPQYTHVQSSGAKTQRQTKTMQASMFASHQQMKGYKQLNS